MKRLITKEEALAALRAAAWLDDPDPKDATCGHPGCTDHPGESEKRIHSFAEAFGCDWYLESAERAVAGAREVWWDSHLLDHELGVTEADGHVVRFDAQWKKHGRPS